MRRTSLALLASVLLVGSIGIPTEAAATAGTPAAGGAVTLADEARPARLAKPPKVRTAELSLALVGTTVSMVSPDVTGTLTGTPGKFDEATVRLTATTVSLVAPFTTTYELTLRTGDTVSASGSATATVDPSTCAVTGSYRVVDPAATILGGTGRYALATGTMTLDGCITPPAAGSGGPYGFTATLIGTIHY